MNCSNAVEIYCLYPISVYSIKEVSLARYYLSGQRLQHEAVSLWWWTSYNLTQVFTVFTVCFSSRINHVSISPPPVFSAATSLSPCVVWLQVTAFFLKRVLFRPLIWVSHIIITALLNVYTFLCMVCILFYPVYPYMWCTFTYIYYDILLFFIHSYDSPIHVILNFAFHLEFRDVGQCDSHNNSDEYNNG